jgi:L-amino acid N-acyltransferase YncA
MRPETLQNLDKPQPWKHIEIITRRFPEGVSEGMAIVREWLNDYQKRIASPISGMAVRFWQERKLPGMSEML